ncbi:MAG: amidohydrolase family protein, partial [Bacteroidota bacterium]
MKRIIFLILLGLAAPVPDLFSQDSEKDIIIVNGRIVDGTGNSWFRSDILIKGDRIVSIARGLKEAHPNALIIDAGNKIVCPGFIDVHGHIEGSIFERPTADNYIYDGVTTVVTGNCGNSANDIGMFLRRIDSVGTSINVATLVGHNTIRTLGMGLENRRASEVEMQKMEAITQKAMHDGAVGMSTGLIYLPGMY